MNANKKVSLLLPEDLLDRAMKASGEGLATTLRRGLELIAAKNTYEALRKFKGKTVLKLNLNKSRRDCDE